MRTDLWSKEEIQILTESWGKLKKDKISKLLPHREWTAIQKKAQKLNLKGDLGLASRQYSFNRSFFDTLTPESCYWAGFIAADGSIEKRDNLVRIGLARKDRIILEEFKKVTQYDGIIDDYEYENKPYSRISYYGAIEWINKLNDKFNVTPKKSLSLIPPNLHRPEFIYPFIIGYFDGDGTSFYYKEKNRKRYAFGFVGTYDVLGWIKFYIDNLINIKLDVNVSICNDYPCLRYSDNSGTIVRNKLLTFDIPFRLKRKWYN